MTDLAGRGLPRAPAILIVLMGSLGDVVRGLALPVALKQRWPQSRLSWLVESRWEPLVRLHPLIDRVLVFHREQGWRGVRAAYRELRCERYDVTLDLQRHFKSGLASWLSRAPRRVGFHRRNAKEFNYLFNTEQVAAAEPDYPKIWHYLKFIEQLGLPKPARLNFGLDQLDWRALVGVLGEDIRSPFVGLVLGSSRPVKDWPSERYLELGRIILNETALNIVLLGTAAEARAAGRLAVELASERVTNLAGRTSLTQLLGVLRAAAACVGPDSGPAHLSAAVGVPYVAVFGPTSARRVGPYGCEELIVTSTLGCRPCELRRCPGLESLCLRLVSAEDVWGKLRLALAKRTPAVL